MIYRARFFPLLGAVTGMYGVIILYFWITGLLFPPEKAGAFAGALAFLMLIPLVIPLNGLNLFILNLCRFGKADYSLLWKGGSSFCRVCKAWWVGYHIFEFISCSQMFMLALDKDVSAADAAIRSKALVKGHGGEILRLKLFGCCIVFSFFLLLPILLLPFLHVVRIVYYLHLSGEAPMACCGTVRT